MTLPYFSIACAAAFLVLGGCSTFEGGTPKGAVNYQPPATAKAKDDTGSLEQEITDQRDWYQLFDSN